MEINPLVLIGIGLATMFFGYFFGLFEGRGQGYKRRKKEEAASGPPVAERPLQSTQTEQISVLRLSADMAGRPQLELDGQRVEASRVDPRQRKRLIEMVVLMRPWIEGNIPQPVSASAPTSPGVPAPTMAERFRQVTGSTQRPQPPASASPVSSPAVAPSSGVSASASVVSPLSMVAQIDAILQTHLLGTHLAEQGVRLMEAPNGGVAVFVGLDRYAGVADVPDPEVQAAIRSAIAEWEAKYTPS
jgi:hypothetical protein